jgi:hypothetical protein
MAKEEEALRGGLDESEVVYCVKAAFGPSGFATGVNLYAGIELEVGA